ncbi:putative very-long-chain 3-oxoacyl-CoA synthase [Rosa chinensis]|uniref:Putative very-long-chain 3-oxoacyl-CoA synthase n=1 Tax=Rosa chinensis TaxID=74649 RepID=A0A2P6SJV5_ROSCH|nr:putative very-long-chain 3-oxoacyl-CoA synthase [Rosa chinensis]
MIWNLREWRFIGSATHHLCWALVRYMEAKKRLKRGNKILMVGFGAGYEYMQ